MGEQAAKDNNAVDLPPGMSWLENQVAGHHSDPAKNNIRMLRSSDGCVLKAGQKEDLLEREVSLYESMKNSQDSLFRELATLTPKYRGTEDYEIQNKKITFLVLEDMTRDMSEPCVMDIKIGRRTWDPLAAPEKRAAEEKKYAESKAAYGFCIPGFQVYDVSTGQLRKFKKDYGKKLNATTVVDALKMFLNADKTGRTSPALLMQLISQLRKIHQFFKKQNKLRFYSSSVLIVYDAHYLRKLLQHEQTSYPSPTCVKKPGEKILKKCMSNEHPTNGIHIGTLSQSSHAFSSPAVALNGSTVVDDASNLKLTVDGPQGPNCVQIKMIDFTHVFPAENEELDINYLEGITSLIKILESFFNL